MHQFKPSSLLFCVVVPFLLASCGSNESAKTSTTDSTMATTTQDTATSTPSENTVITTPENLMVVVHKVADFNKWKASYDGHDSMRLANGIHNYIIGRGVQDSSKVLVATKVDDLDKAKAFAKDPGLKEAMKKGGVVGTPNIRLVTLVYQDRSENMSTLRSLTTFTVKDFDNWKRVFESHRQTRLDNGLTDRAYGYDVDDNHKVMLAIAINDSTKASAFWKSDLLKQQRAESGVTTPPERFIYQVVQRY